MTIFRQSSFLVGFLVCAVASNNANGEDLPHRGLIGVQVGRGADPATPGAAIEDVVPGGAAEKAGVQAGDMVTEIDGKPIKTLQDFLSATRLLPPGRGIKITVVREGKSVPLTLTLAERPRETSDQYEVIYDSVTADGLKLRVLITKPKSSGKFPVMIMIPSPMPSPAEMTSPQPHPFRPFITGLAKAGIATLRLERPGIGDSQGSDPMGTTVQMDVNAYAAAVKKLQSLDYIQSNSVYLFGHGIGAKLLPLIAKKTPVAGIVTYGGLARSWQDAVRDMVQLDWKLADDSITDEQITTRTKKLDQAIKLLLEPKADPDQLAKQHPELTEEFGSLVQQGSVVGLPIAYFQSLEHIGAADWAALNETPVLTLWGKSDFRAPRGCSETIVKWVNAAHPGQAELALLPKIDHFFDSATDQVDSFLSGYQEKFNPVVVQTMDQWVKKHKAA